MNAEKTRIDSFYHWFALQRWEGFGKKDRREKYLPFVTVIEKEFPFKGNWKKP